MKIVSNTIFYPNLTNIYYLSKAFLGIKKLHKDQYTKLHAIDPDIILIDNVLINNIIG